MKFTLCTLLVLFIQPCAWSIEAPDDADDLARVVRELQSQLKSQQQRLEEQQAKIDTQSEEIEKLRSQLPADWLTQERADEIKQMVADVLADADTRASLLQSGALAGHDGTRFFIASADGNFLLKIGGQLQPRYIANFRDQSDDPAAEVIDEAEYGFQMRRMKLFFEGHIITPKLNYRLQLSANRDTAGVDLEEASISYAITEQLRTIVGRFNGALLRDSFTSNTRQLAVERSAVAYIFGANDNWIEGVGLEWRPDDMWRIRTSINDGLGSGTSGGIGNDFASDATDVALTGRVDAKLAGDWKQMDDPQAWSGQPFGAFVGAAVHYEIAETGDNQLTGVMPFLGPYDRFLTWTIDGSIETGGFNIMGALVGQHVTATDASPLGDADNYAVLVQGGYMIVPDKLEPFARYELISIDGAPDDVNIITVGINYYWRAHSMKFTADVVYCLDPLSPANTLGTSLTGAGLLPDNAGSDGQVALRTQIQLLF